MGQSEIYDLLMKEKELTSREIALKLSERPTKVMQRLSQMIKYKEIRVRSLTEEERDNFIKRYPTAKYALRITVYSINNDDMES